MTFSWGSIWLLQGSRQVVLLANSIFLCPAQLFWCWLELSMSHSWNWNKVHIELVDVPWNRGWVIVESKIPDTHKSCVYLWGVANPDHATLYLFASNPLCHEKLPSTTQIPTISTAPPLLWTNKKPAHGFTDDDDAQPPWEPPMRWLVLELRWRLVRGLIGSASSYTRAQLGDVWGRVGFFWGRVIFYCVSEHSAKKRVINEYVLCVFMYIYEYDMYDCT